MIPTGNLAKFRHSKRSLRAADLEYESDDEDYRASDDDSGVGSDEDDLGAESKKKRSLADQAVDKEEFHMQRMGHRAQYLSTEDDAKKSSMTSAGSSLSTERMEALFGRGAERKAGVQLEPFDIRDTDSFGLQSASGRRRESKRRSQKQQPPESKTAHSGASSAADAVDVAPGGNAPPGFASQGRESSEEGKAGSESEASDGLVVHDADKEDWELQWEQHTQDQSQQGGQRSRLLDGIGVLGRPTQAGPAGSGNPSADAAARTSIDDEVALRQHISGVLDGDKDTVRLALARLAGGGSGEGRGTGKRGAGLSEAQRWRHKQAVNKARKRWERLCRKAAKDGADPPAKPQILMDEDGAGSSGGATEEARKAVVQLTDWATRLYHMGHTGVYDAPKAKHRGVCMLHARKLRALRARGLVWEYQWEENRKRTYGPFPGDKMNAWRANFEKRPCVVRWIHEGRCGPWTHGNVVRDYTAVPSVPSVLGKRERTDKHRDAPPDVEKKRKL